MMPGTFSAIMVTTNRCNARCEYCFQRRSGESLGLEQLAVLVPRLLDYVRGAGYQGVAVYWQGGEAALLGPPWYEQAVKLFAGSAAAQGLRADHYLQSNLLDLGPEWDNLLRHELGGSVGSSLDYPNLYRQPLGGAADDYQRLWRAAFERLRRQGIHVGVISVPNEQTLEAGAEKFYTFMVEEVGLSSFQINLPFPGGATTPAKTTYPLEATRLTRFLLDLVDLWVGRGLRKGVTIGPFDALLEYFARGSATLPCIWRANCTDDFLCIDPQGFVTQCDCWASSYPDYRYGNLLEEPDLGWLLEHSPARRKLSARPGVLVRQAGCLECDFLDICHGGCPIRALTTTGDLCRRDPYCPTYQRVFARLQQLAWEGLAESLPPRRGKAPL
jgi:radical SAM protein with 4Fe4S-binding SPASM domain